MGLPTRKRGMSGVAALLSVLPRYGHLLRSQYWRRDVLAVYSRRCLEETLRAAANISFYRERLGQLRPEQDLQSLPTLKRSQIASLNQSVRERCGDVGFFRDRSSGSTGMPAEFLFDAAHQNGRNAARIRYLRANGWNPARRNAWIAAFTSDPADTPDAALLRSRLVLRTQFLPIFDPFERQVERLSRLDPLYLYTLPSNLDGLLRVFEDTGTRLRSLRRILTGGEVLEDSLRERTRAVLGVEISDNYGSTEGFIAWQCPAGTYHINAEHMFVEIVDERHLPVAPGQLGKVLVTTLENRLMPLVRYEIGDYAIAGNGTCRCGRTLPTIAKVIGRGINLFRLPGDQFVSPWPLVGPLKARPQLRQFQIVQDTLDHYIVRFAADRVLDREAEDDIRATFCRVLKMSVSVAFERVDQIPRTPGGKFMTALSRLG